MRFIRKAILLGLFDGVHIGHRSALESLKASLADEKIVYTFSSSGLKTKGERKLILTDDEKRRMLIENGADQVVFADFEKIKDISGEEFAKKVLFEELEAGEVICGENFRFGKNASCNSADLKELMGRMGVAVKIVPIVSAGGEPISTTRIRKLIESGDIVSANRILGYNYFISGRVVHGRALGRELGIRTINTAYDGSKIIPPNGVYSTDVLINGRRYMGITNVGTKPTVGDGIEKGVETHILGFDGDVYDSTASIIFNDFYRKEKKFDSLAELIDAINHDIERRKEENL